MNKFFEAVGGIIVIAVLGGLLTGLLLALPGMLLWNWLMTDLFGLKAITFWQSIGLIWLIGILGSGVKATCESKD